MFERLQSKASQMFDVPAQIAPYLLSDTNALSDIARPPETLLKARRHSEKSSGNRM